MWILNIQVWSHIATLCSVYGVVVVDIHIGHLGINQAFILLLIVVSCCGAVSEQIVHLRTPKETTMGKIMDSCVKMLGMTDDRSLFILKEKQGAQYMTYSKSCSLYHKKIDTCIHILHMCFDFKIHQRNCRQISRLGVCWHRRQETNNWSCTCAKR